MEPVVLYNRKAREIKIRSTRHFYFPTNPLNPKLYHYV